MLLMVVAMFSFVSIVQVTSIWLRRVGVLHPSRDSLGRSSLKCVQWDV